MLCISTSERVLCMPHAGKNNFFDAKTTFSLNFYDEMLKNGKSISTSERRVEHPFAGWNTQQLSYTGLLKTEEHIGIT